MQKLYNKICVYYKCLCLWIWIKVIYFLLQYFDDEIVFEEYFKKMIIKTFGVFCEFYENGVFYEFFGFWVDIWKCMR